MTVLSLSCFFQSFCLYSTNCSVFYLKWRGKSNIGIEVLLRSRKDSTVSGTCSIFFFMIYNNSRWRSIALSPIFTTLRTSRSEGSCLVLARKACYHLLAVWSFNNCIFWSKVLHIHSIRVVYLVTWRKLFVVKDKWLLFNLHFLLLFILPFLGLHSWKDIYSNKLESFVWQRYLKVSFFEDKIVFFT